MRPVATVLVEPERFGDDSVELTGAPYRHLFRARRLVVGDAVQVVDGAGRARAATVERVERDRASLLLGPSMAPREPAIEVELWVASPRPERAGWLIEKASELGVAAVRWLRCERAPRRFGARTLERQRRLAVAALEQSGGSRLTSISGPHDWEALPPLPEASWLLDPAGGQAPLELASGVRTAVLVGPEGGFSPVERQALLDRGCRAWSLGPRVLRIETAALVAAGWLVGGACGRGPGS